ncbi:MAG: hypothetical protein ABII75_03565, partial [Candidatus Omnitrophota bacterium]
GGIFNIFDVFFEENIYVCRRSRRSLFLAKTDALTRPEAGDQGLEGVPATEFSHPPEALLFKPLLPYFLN